MLLTITCTRPEAAAWPATDLGFLLHKNPERVQAFDQSFGTAHVLYPEATGERCTAALVLEVDPIRLVRGRTRQTTDFGLGQYVNDRPYAASSLLSVALGAVFSSALHGRCDQRPELAATALPLRVELPSVPCPDGAESARRVFEPLGWQVVATPLPLDPSFPEWGASQYVRLELTGTLRLADALSHLYVLLPVLDGAKHYWVAADEVDKLIRAGSGWLGDHPDRVWITRRYLARRNALVRTALARLAEIDDLEPEQVDAVDETPEADDTYTVTDVDAATTDCSANAATEGIANANGATTNGTITSAAADTSDNAANPNPADAAVLMEVVEHIDPPRLPAFEHAVFGAAAPATVLVTTPNAEANVRYEGLSPGAFRHHDHRFEWTRAQFEEWAGSVADRHGYRVRFIAVGEPDPDHGSPTQLAVFTAISTATESGAITSATECGATAGTEGGAA